MPNESLEINICKDCQGTVPCIDNFEAIESLLEFDDENTFYWIQVIKRKKDNPEMKTDYSVCSDYCIKNKEDLYKYRDDIIKVCHTYNARAVLWVNRRDYKELSLHIAQLCLEYIQSKQYTAIHRIFAHACGKHKKSGIDIKWIVDIDSKDSNYLNKVYSIIKRCDDNKDFTLHKIIPTLNGFHLICSGFNITKFQQNLVIEGLETIDIQKDNPTVLYFCPK